jgi:hypothetical protein
MREYNQSGLEMMMRVALLLRTIRCSIRRLEASKALIKGARVVGMKKTGKALLIILAAVMRDVAPLTRLNGGSI